MRDIVLMSIVLTLALVALRRPWIGFMLWVWLSLMNPHRFAFGFAYDAPVAAIAAGSTMLGILLTKDRQNPFKTVPVAFFVALTLWVTVSWQLGLDPKGDFAQWDKIMKVNLLLIVGLVLVRTKEQIFVFAWVATLAVALLSTKGGLFTLAHAGSYRVWGPPDSFIAGSNEFAVATIMTIPLLRFMHLQVTNRWVRYGLLAMILLSAASAIGSYSRGALLAIVSMALLLWWRGRARTQGAILMVIVAAVMLTMMPDYWFQRMDTIEGYQEDESAMGRINAWWVSWHVAFEYPTGVGLSLLRPELFAQFAPNPRAITMVAHSIYFQILGHHGFLGLFLFLGIWVSTWLYAARIRKMAAGRDDLRWASDLAGMSQVSLLGYFVGGAFLNLAYYDFPYYVMALVVLTHRWIAQKAWETEPEPKPVFWRRWIGLVALPGAPGRVTAPPKAPVAAMPRTPPKPTRTHQ
jgi:putative inorganic carbon (HCO3(-)) transporter